MSAPPDVLFVMTDQQRFDTIAGLGNEHISTPNLDRLVERGVTFDNAYSTCPVCVPSRYTVLTGREPLTTGVFENAEAPSTHADVERRCGPYLPAVMSELGYRTFGVGKFHTVPWDADLGFEVHLRSEELYGSAAQRERDDYARFVAQRSEVDFVERPLGERTEMYCLPQVSPLPASLNQASWAADRAVELLDADDGRPVFGFVSFVGPHPPYAPPAPFNRRYDPDQLPAPVRGDLALDHLDDTIPWMNHAVFAECLPDPLARIIKARYYGAISFIDACLGRLLDAVEGRPRERDTVICFFSDHGDHMGDHHAWEKRSFFESSCRVPLLVSWPRGLSGGARSPALASLADLFGVATSAAGMPDLRDGAGLLDVLDGRREPRRALLGCYGQPGTRAFKAMLRTGSWKYVFMANGGREQLFDVAADPHELRTRIADEPAVADRLRGEAVAAVRAAGGTDALDGDGLLALPFLRRPRGRIHQFDGSSGVHGYGAP